MSCFIFSFEFLFVDDLKSAETCRSLAVWLSTFVYRTILQLLE